MIDTPKSSQLHVWLGISHMFAPYHRKSCFTLVLSPSLEDEQRLSVGVLLTDLKYQIHTIDSCINTSNTNINISGRAYY
jgi:hypothetical protein